MAATIIVIRDSLVKIQDFTVPIILFAFFGYLFGLYFLFEGRWVFGLGIVLAALFIIFWGFACVGGFACAA